MKVHTRHKCCVEHTGSRASMGHMLSFKKYSHIWTTRQQPTAHMSLELIQVPQNFLSFKSNHDHRTLPFLTSGCEVPGFEESGLYTDCFCFKLNSSKGTPALQGIKSHLGNRPRFLTSRDTNPPALTNWMQSNHSDFEWNPHSNPNCI